jgi:hypothetical protein
VYAPSLKDKESPGSAGELRTGASWKVPLGNDPALSPNFTQPKLFQRPGSIAWAKGCRFNGPCPPSPAAGQKTPARNAGTSITVTLITGSLDAFQWQTPGASLPSDEGATIESSPFEEAMLAAPSPRRDVAVTDVPAEPPRELPAEVKPEPAAQDNSPQVATAEPVLLSICMDRWSQRPIASDRKPRTLKTPQRAPHSFSLSSMDGIAESRIYQYKARND